MQSIVVPSLKDFWTLRELITATITTRVAFWDLPSGFKKKQPVKDQGKVSARPQKLDHVTKHGTMCVRAM